MCEIFAQGLKFVADFHSKKSVDMNWGGVFYSIVYRIVYVISHQIFQSTQKFFPKLSIVCL